MGFNFSILKKKTCFKENKVQVKQKHTLRNDAIIPYQFIADIVSKNL